ncbi:MAG TPA: uroporphyrinogen-III C-methyltransferase, partial [Sphingopyxis sp.]|nr:uroporphyrinogen-III C-methyltransferase [Sphingopyxis sp.]
LDIDWSSLARGGSTLAFYMGREAAGEIRRGLMQAGMPGEMPVMIACEVSGPGERRLVTRLDLLDLATKSFAADAPTLILVGAAVMLAGSAPALPANSSRATYGR